MDFFPSKIAIWLFVLFGRFCLHYRLSNIHIPCIFSTSNHICRGCDWRVYSFFFLRPQSFCSHVSVAHLFLFEHLFSDHFARPRACMCFFRFVTSFSSIPSLMVFLFIVIVHFYLFWTNNNLRLWREKNARFRFRLKNCLLFGWIFFPLLFGSYLLLLHTSSVTM